MSPASPFLENDPFYLLKPLSIQHDITKELCAHCPQKPSLSLSSEDKTMHPAAHWELASFFPFSLEFAPKEEITSDSSVTAVYVKLLVVFLPACVRT